MNRSRSANWIARHALRLAMDKKGPSRFLPYNRQNDFCYAFLSNEETTGAVSIVDSIEDNYVVGRHWDGDFYRNEMCLRLDQINSSDVQISQIYGLSQTDHKSALAFLVSYYARIPQGKHYNERLKQWAYSQRTRFRRDRIELLRLLTEAELRRRTENRHDRSGRSAVEWFFLIYGNRSASLPSYHAEQTHFDLLLESLEKSGEIENAREKGHYLVSGKALATIADFELEERRHRRSYFLNFMIVVLTFVLAVSAAIDIFSFFQS